MTANEFSPSERALLDRYVTNTDKDIFALRNLPEVIKGALFSRYSRSTLGLRSLLLKEFIQSGDSSFLAITGDKEGLEGVADQSLAIQKAKEFYDRILDSYGDDSIGELGGAHLALENISIIAAKAVEDSRIGGSPLEKSTRYIYFDQKVNGQYLYYREPLLMTSAFRDDYLATCDHLFDTYSRLIGELTPIMEKKNPKSPDLSKTAYAAAIRAKTLDCLRGLLPASTLTNMGLYGNGRFFEYLINKLECHPLKELQDIGKQSFNELSTLIPSFVRRAELTHKNHLAFAAFSESMQEGLKRLAKKTIPPAQEATKGAVSLIDFDSNAVNKVAAALLFSCGRGSLEEIKSYVATLPYEEVARLFDAASSPRANRRHKSPRALEQAHFTFDLVADFGVYRDLHRHRILSQERQLLCCDHGYYLPDEIKETPMEKSYCEAMERAHETFDRIVAHLPEEAQYGVPMAFNVRWYFTINLRSLQWLCELRSQPQGHPTYRRIAQEMAASVIKQFPQFECFFKFVDMNGYDLGRLAQELKKEEKQKQIEGLTAK